MYSRSDYLLALETPATPELIEQAERLFACRFLAGEQEPPLTQASMPRWVGEDTPLREVAPLRATQVELAHRRLRVYLHSLHAVQD